MNRTRRRGGDVTRRDKPSHFFWTVLSESCCIKAFFGEGPWPCGLTVIHLFARAIHGQPHSVTRGILRRKNCAKVPKTPRAPRRGSDCIPAFPTLLFLAFLVSWRSWRFVRIGPPEDVYKGETFRFGLKRRGRRWLQFACVSRQRTETMGSGAVLGRETDRWPSFCTTSSGVPGSARR